MGQPGKARGQGFFTQTKLTLVSLPSWFTDARESCLAIFAAQKPVFVAWQWITLVWDG